MLKCFVFIYLKGNAMSNNFKKSLDILGESVKQKNKGKVEKTQKGDDSEIIQEGAKKRGRKTGKSNHKIIKDAGSKLESYAKRLNIKQFDLFPGHEYPTPFTRIPLFIPSHRKRAREIQNDSLLKGDFTQLESSWDGGGVFRSGPALTVYDEDTFIGMLHLRRFGLEGIPSNMPSKNIGILTEGGEGETNLYSHNNKKVKVHSGYFLVSEVESLIVGRRPPKNGWPGSNLTKRRESIERLGATILKFTRPQNVDEFRGKQIQMVAIDWIGSESDACYYFEIHPAVVVWLDVFRTYIDLNIRRKLTPFGKSLHRFLSSQKSNKEFSKSFEDVCAAIGCFDSQGEAKRKSERQLDRLIELGFLSAWKITGTGRGEPFVLHVNF